MSVSADWIGNTNNNVEIKLNQNINIIGWQITTDENIPYEFVSDENIVNNQNTENNTINTSLPNNVMMENTVQNQTNTNTSNVIQQIQPRTEPIVINTSLDIDKTYYFWIKDSYGNTRYQTFIIHKAVI